MTILSDEQVMHAMKGVGIQLSSSMLSKCMAVAKNHKITSNELATVWEAHSLNTNVMTLDSNTFTAYHSALLKHHDASTSNNNKKKNVDGNSSPMTMKASSSSSSPDTPPTPVLIGAVVPRSGMAKRSLDLTQEGSGEAQDDGTSKKQNTNANIVTPAKQQQQQQQQAASRVMSNAFDNRKNSGQIIHTYNPHNLSSLPTTTPSSSNDTSTVRIQTNITKKDIVQPYPYMNDVNRSKVLDLQLKQMQNDMLDSNLIHTPQDNNSDNQISTSNNDDEKQSDDDDDDAVKKLAPLESVGVPRQTLQTNIGRVCNEAHFGKMNSTSILLEGDCLYSNGARITLDVNSMNQHDTGFGGSKGYSLFPGQLVAVEGRNGTGRKMVVERICEGLPPTTLPTPTTMTTTTTSNSAMRVFAVAGPFTTITNLEYTPFVDLLEMFVIQECPDVVILMGPFVDMSHPMVKDGEGVTLEFSEEDGEDAKKHVSYETLFAAKIAAKLEDLYEDKPDLKTQFVLVPSLDDVIAEPVYPQPPLQDTIPQGKEISHFNETQILPLGSLGLEHIETAGGNKPNKNDRRIHLVSNPATIQINDTVIGITSTDTLLHLSSEEINSNLPPGSRMTRLTEHIIEQRSYYPVYPPPEAFDNMNLDVTKREEYSISVRPDILLLPSKLASFARDVRGGTVVVNPGHLVKGIAGGTFAALDLHPVKDSSSSSSSDSEKVDVKDRIKVEIRRI